MVFYGEEGRTEPKGGRGWHRYSEEIPNCTTESTMQRFDSMEIVILVAGIAMRAQRQSRCEFLPEMMRTKPGMLLVFSIMRSKIVTKCVFPYFPSIYSKVNLNSHNTISDVRVLRFDYYSLSES